MILIGFYELEAGLVRVLFVCLGNVCRSPLAQGVFEDLVRREGFEDEIFVDSAGTGHRHIGKPPDKRAQESARQRGLDISSLQARLIQPEDCDRFDYILTMDKKNYRKVTLLYWRRSLAKPFLGFQRVATSLYRRRSVVRPFLKFAKNSLTLRANLR